MGGGGDEVRRRRRNVNQNLGTAYCWATCQETGEPCTEKVSLTFSPSLGVARRLTTNLCFALRFSPVSI